jgi:hypothetical protein
VRPPPRERDGLAGDQQQCQPQWVQLIPVRQQRQDVDGRQGDRDAAVLQAFLTALRQRGNPGRQPVRNGADARRQALHVPIVRSPGPAADRP